MFKVIMIIGVVVIGILYFILYIKKENNIEKMLTSSDTISLEIMMGFSNLELIKRLKCYYKGNEKTIFLEYADERYLKINTDDFEKNLIKQLEDKQELMIKKSNDSGEECVVKDSLNRIMYQVWLNYAYKSNYKKLFWQEITEIYYRGEMSTSTYNDVYMRFYKYKYLDK